YRYFCLKMARANSIFGAARNLFDGSVEVIAVGEREALEVYLDALRQGPSYANVESVETAELDERRIEEFSERGDFDIL
ncbi:MAG: acylphosphatase, partial [Candidatus Zixiibacteriota bacterium]